jgi:hypothetical protein
VGQQTTPDAHTHALELVTRGKNESHYIETYVSRGHTHTHTHRAHVPEEVGDGGRCELRDHALAHQVAEAQARLLVELLRAAVGW